MATIYAVQALARFLQDGMISQEEEKQLLPLGKVAEKALKPMNPPTQGLKSERFAQEYDNFCREVNQELILLGSSVRLRSLAFGQDQRNGQNTKEIPDGGYMIRLRYTTETQPAICYPIESATYLFSADEKFARGVRTTTIVEAIPGECWF